MFLNDLLTRAMVEYLTGRVSHYQRRIPNDLDILKERLRPGDVLLVEGDSRISQVIKYLTQSSWSHATIYVGDALLRWGGPHAERALDAFGPDAAHLLVESDLKEGVIVVPVSKYLESNIRVCRPQGLRPGSLDRVMAELFEHLGVRYDQRNILDLARYLLPFHLLPRRLRPRSLYLGSSTSREVICSALIAKAFYRAGLSIQPPVSPLRGGGPAVRHPSYIMPRDFDLSGSFQILKLAPPAPALETPAPWD
ncbi:MAG TPA: YiiX/YebB-like N1pC/P60 family cysteine hydrolase [Holophaga sp.]|nr:YiiX/YebB-like N1pC/P60 family cysteine hydrolase [Holophaga sp.]